MWWLMLLACGQPESPRGFTRVSAEVDVAGALAGLESRAVFNEERGAWRLLSSGVRVFVDDRGAAFSLRGVPSLRETRLELLGIGRRQPEAKPARRIHAEGARVSVAREGGVEEWFQDRPEGVEHGFTLEERPAGAGRLGVWLSFDDQVSVSPTAVRVLDETGSQTGLGYDHLEVFDADGRVLPAEFTLGSCQRDGCTVVLDIDDAGASWPLTVDPMFNDSLQVIENFPSPQYGGWSVATDGGWVMVGVPGNHDGNDGIIQMRARNTDGGSTWGIHKTIDPGFRTLGMAVALEFPRAVAGAPDDSTAAFLQFEDGDWRTIHSFERTGDFGASVALGGTHAAVGNPAEGTVETFWQGTDWATVEVLEAPEPGKGFGTAIDMDGDHLVVGAPNPAGTGKVYVYRRVDEDPLWSWSLVAELAPGESVARAEYGASVHVFQGMIAVGAPGLDRGAVFVFEQDGSSSWEMTAKVEPPPGDISAFGSAIAADGPFLDVMARRGLDKAEVHFYEDSSEVDERFGYVESLEVGESTETHGIPMSIATSEHIIVTGAAETEVGLSRGRVHVIKRKEIDEFQKNEMSGADLLGEGDWEVGYAVAIDADLAAVSAPAYDGNGADAGAVVFLRREGSEWRVLDSIIEGSRGSRYGEDLGLSNNRAVVCSTSLREGGMDLLEFDGARFTVIAGLDVEGVAGLGVACDIEHDIAAVSSLLAGHVAVFGRTGAGVGGWEKVDDLTGTPASYGLDLAVDDGRIAVADSAPAEAYVYDIATFGQIVEVAGSPLALAGGTQLTGVAIQDEQVLMVGQDRMRVWREELTGWAQKTRTFDSDFLPSIAVAGDHAFVGKSLDRAVLMFSRNSGGADQWAPMQNRRDLYEPDAGSFGRSVAATSRTLLVGADGANAAYFYERVANNAPHAYDDTFTGVEDMPITFGVLLNDRDPNGDILTVVNAVTQDWDVLEEFDVDSGGIVSMRTVPNWCSESPNQPIQFAYTVSDGEHEVTAGGLVEVDCVNDPPMGLPDAYIVDEDELLDVTLQDSVLANDVDVDGDVLAATVHTSPAHGTLNLRSDGTFTYRPDRDYNGQDQFSYTVDDGVIPALPTTVSIGIRPVNDAPVAITQTYDIQEGQQLDVPVPGLLALLSDVDGDEITVTISNPPDHGELRLFANGEFIYSPEALFIGTDVFTFVGSDGQAESNQGWVELIVSEVNEAPVGVDDAWQLYEDSVFVRGERDGVLANDSDPDDAAHYLRAQLVSPTTRGDLSFGERGGFEYRPDPDYHGADSFTYEVLDPQDAVSNRTTVTLEVLPVNDAPVAMDDDFIHDVPGELEWPAEDGVLSNDFDPDGDRLTAVLTVRPRHGDLDLRSNGSFVYTPDPGFRGSDSFGYLASDGALQSVPAAQVTIRVLTAGGDTGETGPGTGGDTACTPIRLYLDKDGDGFGAGEEVMIACEVVEGLSLTADDCDDDRADRYPGAREIVGDGEDQDCNGTDGAIVPIGACQTGRGGQLLWIPLALLALGGRRRRAVR